MILALNQQNHDLYALNKKELEEIEKEEMNSHMFRTKIKWIEEGEKNCKFFMALEKQIILTNLYQQ